MEEQRAVCVALAGHRLPRWRELPDLELYMDQVLALIERYLGAYPGYDGKGLTAAMVNNYVKHGILPAPLKKKYSREHLARLIVICVLKGVLPIASVQQLLTGGTHESTERFYDGFCELFEQAGKAVAASAAAENGEASDTVILRAALRAQAEQSLAQKLLAARED